MYLNTIDRFLSNIKKTGTCWIYCGTVLSNGYGQIMIARKRWLAHRLSYTHHIGPIPSGLMVCHTCDNPTCVNPKHFFLGDCSDNAIDAVKKGRWNSARGESHGHAKLTEKKVRIIRVGGKSDSYFARKYKVSRSVVSEARAGKTWAHVK